MALNVNVMTHTVFNFKVKHCGAIILYVNTYILRNNINILLKLEFAYSIAVFYLFKNSIFATRF